MKINNKGENPYKTVRKHLVSDILLEFLGPKEGEVELLTENPVKRYVAGMIFPVDYESRMDDSKDRLLDGENDPVIAEETDNDIQDRSSANSFYPSVMGMSFYCLGENPELSVNVEWTRYRRMEHGEYSVEISEIPQSITQLAEYKDNFELKEGRLYTKGAIDYKLTKFLSGATEDKNLKNIFRNIRKLSKGAWISTSKKKELLLSSGFESELVDEGLELVCEKKFNKKTGLSLFVLAIKNNQPACPNGMDEEHVFFNTSMKVHSAGKQKNIFAEYFFPPSFRHDPEEKSLALLYRKRKTFAVGHGCSANWNTSTDSTYADSVFTEALPTFEVPKIEFNIPGLDINILSMKELAGEGNIKSAEIIEKLREFCSFYKQWINGLVSNKDLSSEFSETLKKHVDLCNESYSRMVEGIEVLNTDPLVLRAFQLANKAMYIQSLHTELQKVNLKKKRLPTDEPVQWPEYNSKEAYERRWRPFQLGFLLLSIKGVVEPDSLDRNIVDLVWFPTGGGKTEAYLGLSSFTIFYRRLKYPGTSGGTAVIMRYTLRLLTSQQFQRACTLICAMENIRQQNLDDLGSEEISIGLWVGMDSTPNNLNSAEEDFQAYIFGESDKNPSPLLSCPWCGTQMVIEHGGGHREYGYKRKTKHAILYCLDRTCMFNKRLPVLFVDEEIYGNPPTLLFGTVDKFAQMPVQRGVSHIFAANNGNSNLPPELIIQDELHLISGALGTLVGIYEMAVDFLCSRKGLKPKVVASTATIRRATEQCKSLFDRTAKQFPAPGIDISDSFFAREISTKEEPGRLYLGIMPSGKTQTTAAVRLTAKLLYSVYTLKADDEVKDKFWTLVSYFNSIRELGGFISLTHDDIPMYMNTLRQRYGGVMRAIFVQRELTSRKKAEEIPEILEQLSVGYPDRNAIDVLAATNMLSVGIDIDRFGLMVIRGQPKLTSEYIQVSGRIGRKYPGLIITLYNSARTRDRAHYERFKTYHESFHRNVEPSSVTPFSAPSRIRALSSVLVTMFRHGIDAKFEDEFGASLLNPEQDDLKVLRQFIFERVKNIDDSESKDTMAELDKLLEEWDMFIKENGGKVVYKAETMGTPIVRKPGGLGKGLWIFPTSMRNVDAECNIEIRDE